MALAARSNLVDLVTNLEVIAKDSGCLLDLSAILDLSICPTIDIFLPKPHRQEIVDNDYIVVTPTSSLETRGSKSYTPPKWCKKSALDVDLLVLVQRGLVLDVDLEMYLNLLHTLHLDVDLDLDLRNNLDKRSAQVDSLITVDANIDLDKRSALPAPLLVVDLDVDLDLGLNLDIDLDHDISIGNQHVRHARKHFAPQCGKKIPDATPGCHKITATDAADCLAKCHKSAVDLTLAANAEAADTAKVVDCTGVSFYPELTIDNCLVAHVDLLGLVSVDVKVETLVRI